MASLTKPILCAATLVTGFLAGTVFDRAIIAAPAWRIVGSEAWAEFSRHADLGVGLLLYPLEGLGAALLTIAAAICIRLDRSASRAASIAVYAAALFSIAGLILTVKAAPIMLSIERASDPAALRGAFEDFTLWGLYLRGLCDIASFVGNALALMLVHRAD